jgi:hypothetical protein
MPVTATSASYSLPSLWCPVPDRALKRNLLNKAINKIIYTTYSVWFLLFLEVRRTTE